MYMACVSSHLKKNSDCYIFREKMGVFRGLKRGIVFFWVKDFRGRSTGFLFITILFYSSRELS